MNNYPTITIIVLSYNSQPHLATCFGALAALDYPTERLELMLVDNASTDESATWTQTQYPAVKIVQTGDNLGFAGGNNAGAAAAAGEYIVILNPDTRVAPSWLRELIQPLMEDDPPTAVASKVLSWEGQQIDFADAAINFMGWGCQPGFR